MLDEEATIFSKFKGKKVLEVMPGVSYSRVFMSQQLGAILSSCTC